MTGRTTHLHFSRASCPHVQRVRKAPGAGSDQMEVLLCKVHGSSGGGTSRCNNSSEAGAQLGAGRPASQSHVQGTSDSPHAGVGIARPAPPQGLDPLVLSAVPAEVIAEIQQRQLVVHQVMCLPPLG